MAEEHAEFTLVSVLPLTQNYPPASAVLELTQAEAQWDYSFSLAFSRFNDTRDSVTIHLNFKLYRIGDPAKTTIAETGVKNVFSVTKGLSADAKLQVLWLFLPIVVANLQGIYAAKTTGSPLHKILPPVMDFYNKKEYLQKRIANEWK